MMPRISNLFKVLTLVFPVFCFPSLAPGCSNHSTIFNAKRSRFFGHDHDWGCTKQTASVHGMHLLQQGKSPQNGTERVSVTSAKTFFSLKDWAKMKSESSIIYVTMEKKHSGQAPTLGL